MVGIFHEQAHVGLEVAVSSADVKAADAEVHFGNFVGDAFNYAGTTVGARHAEVYDERAFRSTHPFCLHDPVAIVSHQVLGVGAFTAVNLQASISRQVSEDLISLYGVAAGGHRVFKLVSRLAVDEQAGVPFFFIGGVAFAASGLKSRFGGKLDGFGDQLAVLDDERGEGLGHRHAFLGDVEEEIDVAAVGVLLGELLHGREGTFNAKIFQLPK